MENQLHLILKGKDLIFAEGSPRSFHMVADNDDYTIKVDIAPEDMPDNIKAWFVKGDSFKEEHFNSDNIITVDKSILAGGGWVKFGITGNGYATRWIEFYVDPSIKTGVIGEITNAVNTIKLTEINEDGELVFTLDNGTVFNAGHVVGDGDIIVEALPPVTADDNGKILQVDNGEWAVKSLPTYDGEYNVIPRITMQNLNTASKFMTDDVEISAIPYAQVSNSANGETITIG